jgi:MFS family permease
VSIREVSHAHETIKETLTEGWSFVREVPSFNYLLLAVVGIGFCDVVLEFRFFVTAKGTISDPVNYKNFYSLYLLVAAIVSFAVQGFLTSRIVQRIQLKNTFLIQPLMALSTSVAMIASPKVISATISSLLLKVSRNTIDEATRKAYQGLVPEERRGRVALFTDNYAPAVGMVLAAAVTGLIVYIGNRTGFGYAFYIYLGVSILAASFALWAILRMRAVYDSSMMNWRLKRRKRAVEVLKKLEF